MPVSEGACPDEAGTGAPVSRETGWFSSHCWATFVAICRIPRMRRTRRKIVSEHPKGEMDVKFKAFVERITWYSLGIVAIDADVSYEQRLRADAVGSGTACTWKGQSLILTAEHVVGDTQPDRLAFLLRVDDALNWEGMGKPANVVQRVPLPIETIVRDKKNDLAAIVLRSELLTNPRMQFCELPKQLKRGRTVRSKGSLILHGFPRDQQYAISEKKISNASIRQLVAQPIILPVTIASRTSTTLPRLSYDPDRDVLVHYEPPKDLNMKPHGFSGAAVWCQRSRQSGSIWTPCPMMFGLQTRAYMTSKLLQIVDALTIRNFLKESF